MTDIEPVEGDLTLCGCGGVIHYVEAYMGLVGEPTDAWWSHYVHPEDGHDAEPDPTKALVRAPSERQRIQRALAEGHTPTLAHADAGMQVALVILDEGVPEGTFLLTAADAQSFTCPRCGATSWHPMDLRFGWCGRCYDFTGDPTDFIVPGRMSDVEQSYWDRRVMQHASAVWLKAKPSLLSPEEHDAMFEQNRVTFLAHEAWAIAVPRPESFVVPPFEPKEESSTPLWRMRLHWLLWEKWTLAWRRRRARRSRPTKR